MQLHTLKIESVGVVTTPPGFGVKSWEIRHIPRLYANVRLTAR